jgi:hypothetical protein
MIARKMEPTTVPPAGVDLDEHDAREFCAAHGYTFEIKQGWWRVSYQKKVMCEYRPATGLTRFIPHQPKFRGPQADYQVANWAGAEAIIRSRTRWSAEQNAKDSNPSKSE